MQFFKNHKSCVCRQLTRSGNCDIGPGARRGDSGGGFVFLYPHTGKYYLRGIVSARIITQVSTSLFTDITRYKKWIKTNAVEFENRIFRK